MAFTFSPIPVKIKHCNQVFHGRRGFLSATDDKRGAVLIKVDLIFLLRQCLFMANKTVKMTS